MDARQISTIIDESVDIISMSTSNLMMNNLDRTVKLDEWEAMFVQKGLIVPASEEMDIVQPSSPIIGDVSIDKSQAIISHGYHKETLLDDLDTENENGQFYTVKRNLLSDFDELENHPT